MSTVLVTGCSSGIGLETAIALGRAGHAVYATMRKPEADRRLQETVRSEKLPVSILALDVDSDESVATAFATVRSKGVFLDALVNNAGIDRLGSIEELPFEAFRASMETNYFGLAVHSRLFARNEETPKRMHCERNVGRRTNFDFPHVSVRSLEVCVGSS